MNHLSDRRRAECALLPRLLLGIANDGGFRCYDDAGNVIDGAEAAVVDDLKALLTKASIEPVVGLEAGRAAKLARRVDRLAGALFDEWRGASAAKWALAVMFIIRDLHDSGQLMLNEGSAMHRAYLIFVPMLEDALDDPAICKSAAKQARHLRERFGREGYFREDAA